VGSRGCPHSARFQRQIGAEYNETMAGQIAPLRSVYPHRKWPVDLANVSPASAVPTFILLDDGREVGRFMGYRNRETFWARLGELQARLPQPDAIRIARLPRPRPEPMIAPARRWDLTAIFDLASIGRLFRGDP
jgi:hypothetical protein